MVLLERRSALKVACTVPEIGSVTEDSVEMN
jgi:hypothetical protein